MIEIWRLLSFFAFGFLFFAAFANLCGIDVGQAIADPKATDWMQAVGSLGTFFIAILVFRRWRLPDDAKRRADAAQELIRLSAQLEAAALSSRSGSLTVLFEATDVSLDNKVEALKEFFHHPPRQATERLSALRSEMVARETEIQALFGEPATTSTKDFLALTQEIIHSHDILKHTAEPTDFYRKQPKFAEVIDGEMRILGVRVITDAEETGDWEVDHFGDQLRTAGIRARQHLAAFLTDTEH